MSTILYPSPIFGPVRSRRLGVSLGINLMPGDGKICTFDCIYCECGRNSERRPLKKRPSPAEVSSLLKIKLEEMRQKKEAPDVITFAGNGEPTAHPNFAEIVDDTIRLRNIYYPKAKISVLSNGTRLSDKAVFNALLKVDNNIQKLDTVNPYFIETVNRPVVNYNLEKTINDMISFNGHIIIQTLFLTGYYNGKNLDNTGDEYVLPWIEILKKISPSEVMIYTLDRETPVTGLKKASSKALDRIVNKLKENGLKAKASY